MVNLDLKPWQRSGLLTPTRTRGEIGFSKNGTQLDIHIRVNGKLTWFAVRYESLRQKLNVLDESVSGFKLLAESDGNAGDMLVMPEFKSLEQQMLELQEAIAMLRVGLAYGNATTIKEQTDKISALAFAINYNWNNNPALADVPPDKRFSGD